jgi:hypothetical protein
MGKCITFRFLSLFSFFISSIPRFGKIELKLNMIPREIQKLLFDRLVELSNHQNASISSLSVQNMSNIIYRCANLSSYVVFVSCCLLSSLLYLHSLGNMEMEWKPVLRTIKEVLLKGIETTSRYDNSQGISNIITG